MGKEDANYNMGKLHSACDHLDNAAAALAALASPTRTSDLTANFSSFLSSMSAFNAHLAQFSKQTEYLTNWFNQIKKENNDDELMYFFRRARNQTDHGGDAPVDFSWSVSVKPKRGGSVLTSRLGTAWDVSPDLSEENVTYTFRLVAFQSGRPTEDIALPTSHFGQPIGDDALEATRLVLQRMKETFDTAWAIAHAPELHVK